MFKLLQIEVNLEITLLETILSMLVGCLAIFELCQRCRAHWETNINAWSLGIGLLPTLSLCEKHCKTGDVFQSFDCETQHCLYRLYL